MIDSYRSELRRYRQIGEKALAQMSDDDLNSVPAAGGNSAAMIVRHIQGNLTSRFTDFLDSDGEKPWRDREGEFEERGYDRGHVETLWRDGWGTLETALAPLTDDDLSRTVTIRGVELTVDESLARAVGHLAYHVGQLVLLARIPLGEEWDWITIPRGGSAAYNANPTKEKGFEK